MANSRQSSTKRLKMAERAQQQLDIHFPDMPSYYMWHRTVNDGYITVPRTLPIAMQAIDMNTKGQPAGHTLFCLWARSPDHTLVTIENPSTFAFEAGFTGERAVDTWRRRMKKLRELGFIMTKPGSSGEFHYVLLINPNAAMEFMRFKKQLSDEVYSRFIDRAADVGAYREVEAVKNHLNPADEKTKIAAGKSSSGSKLKTKEVKHG